MTDKIFNWGILGPGSIAHKFASDLKLLPKAKLYAVGSRSIDRARAFGSQFGAEKYYGSYEELVSDPKLDIIYIATPHVRHYCDSLLCMENGKAVLCEKPVAMNTGQYKVMVDIAGKNKVFFMEALWTRFIPSFKKCLQVISDGEIGEIRLIESDFCFNAPYDKNGRLFNPMLGGGSLLDIGLYPVFLALELAGSPKEIKALASFDKSGIDTSCSLLFAHEKNILSVLFSSILSNGRTEAIIHGSEGILRLNRHWHIPTSLDVIHDDKEKIHHEFDEPGYGYQYEAEEVMKCLENGKMESDVFSLEKSLRLITALDNIRSLIGLKYPAEVEAV